MKRLEQKIALITGAAKGMGAEEARLFAQEGASLIITDMDMLNLDKVTAELRDKGAKVIAFKHDVSVESQWKTIAHEAEKAYGKVDILINNAGIAATEGVEATTSEIWNQILAVNLTGTWLGMKYIIPLMRKAGGGSIINISSIYGLIGSGTSAAYQATKGGVRLLTKTAAIEYVGEKIRVNSIHPGFIDTPMVSGAITPEALTSILSLVPMKRLGSSLEIANGALFLASDESSYMTGSELVIDGGYTCQ